MLKVVTIKNLLSQKTMILVFSYAPAGLGHLRVTKALYDGLPETVTPILLGSHDPVVTAVYRVLSVNRLARAAMEFAQNGVPQYFFTRVYRWYLRTYTYVIFQQMRTVLEQRIDLPKRVLVIATHYGLAHQLAAIKVRLEQEEKIKIVLVIQVTDDSPQWIWYVEGADLIVVPSEKTKQTLIHYGRREGLKPVLFNVAPYPVSPRLARPFHPGGLDIKFAQFNPESKHRIQVSIPISGAAVGMAYYDKLITSLNQLSARYEFHITAKSIPYTSNFLNTMMQNDSVKLHISSHDRGVVDLYEKLYQIETIGLEITKPSEQAFKALIPPTEIGGSILLFSHGVGRQEYDNLNFLRRHMLIPTVKQQHILWRFAKQEVVEQRTLKQLLVQATQWRGVLLPDNPTESGQFIDWCLRNGIFLSMMHCRIKPSALDPRGEEITPHGVAEFWKRVTQLM